MPLTAMSKTLVLFKSIAGESPMEWEASNCLGAFLARALGMLMLKAVVPFWLTSMVVLLEISMFQNSLKKDHFKLKLMPLDAHVETKTECREK